MNLQALYDLKDRLEHAAIAGTTLIQEDFRLHRAVEALAPLANANPVFGKISAGAKSLLIAQENERSTRLLEVLSLVDAVVYTQGITNLAGEITVLEQRTASYVQASYGELHPLLTALKGTGSGRTSLIRECWKSHPDYFSDFRILPHVVGALGDNYGELTDPISEILMKQGTAIIPLLKEKFDPEGKTEMARRVRLVAKLAGEKENDWFVNILPESKKDVREAVIQALSLSQDNAQLLLDLCQSERGKLREAALRSCAVMDTEEAAAFWAKEVQKKPNTVSCLKGVCSTLAADLSAGAMRTFLENMLAEGQQIYEQSDLEQITMLTAVVCGKYSAEIDSLWCWIAERMDQFAAVVPENKVRSCNMNLAEHLQKTLMHTILWNSCPEVLAMAKKLGTENREWFLCCAMLADMAEISAGELYERYAPFLVKTGLLKRESNEQRNDRIQIMRALSAVRWNPERNAYTVVFPRWDALTGNPVTSARKLDGMDPRWMTLLTDPKVNQDGAVYNLTLDNYHKKVEPAIDWLISWLVDGSNQELCELAGSWLYQWIMETGNLTYHFYDLLRCGWKNWRGMLTHCANKNGEISYTQTQSLLRMIPISNAEKAAELRDLDQIAETKNMKVQYGLWPHEAILRQIAILESDPNAEL